MRGPSLMETLERQRSELEQEYRLLAANRALNSTRLDEIERALYRIAAQLDRAQRIP